MRSKIRARHAALALAVPALLVTAPAASADPISLSSTKLTASWEGTGSGLLATQDVMDRAGCTPGIHDCVDQLIKLDEPGFLTVHTSSEDPAAVDTDLQLFYAEADGTVGDEIDESAAADPTPDETVGSSLDAGYYVARIDYAIAANGVVKADATFEPETP